MIRRISFLTAGALLCALVSATSASALEAPCALIPKAKCFGVESASASLSTTQAGAHPDATVSFGIRQDPESVPTNFGLYNAYAPTRKLRIELPPGLIGNPNVMGTPQQCMVAELQSWQSGGGCPNGSQIGIATLFVYGFTQPFVEPVYMMAPPGGDVVARLGMIAGIYPTYIDLRVRSESDYGLSAEVAEAPAAAGLIRAETTIWGVPAASAHDNERCTAGDAFLGCQISRRPSSRIATASLHDEPDPLRGGPPDRRQRLQLGGTPRARSR